MRIIKNFKILWNDVSFNRSVKMLGVVMAAAMALFAALWFLGVGIKAFVIIKRLFIGFAQILARGFHFD